MKRSEIDLDIDGWIIEAGTLQGWKRIYARDVTLLSFTKMIQGERSRINVWPTKMTVASFLIYPKQGKMQKYRRNVGRELMGQIFENPHEHTQSGYQRKTMYLYPRGQ